MAEVTGFTAARMLAMEDATIIDARLDGYNLILITKDTTEIDVGDVRGPIGPVGPVGQVPEAPVDTNVYARINQGWETIPCRRFDDNTARDAWADVQLGYMAIMDYATGPMLQIYANDGWRSLAWMPSATDKRVIVGMTGGTLRFAEGIIDQEGGVFGVTAAGSVQGLHFTANGNVLARPQDGSSAPRAVMFGANGVIEAAQGSAGGSPYRVETGYRSSYSSPTEREITIQTGRIEAGAATGSSRRWKQNIQNVDLAEDILKLRPVSFRWIEDQIDAVGMIAEEVADINDRFARWGKDPDVTKTAPVLDPNEEDASKSEAEEASYQLRLAEADDVPIGLDEKALISGLVSLCKRQEQKINDITSRLEALESA